MRLFSNRSVPELNRRDIVRVKESHVVLVTKEKPLTLMTSPRGRYSPAIPMPLSSDAVWRMRTLSRDEILLIEDLVDYEGLKGATLRNFKNDVFTAVPFDETRFELSPQFKVILEEKRDADEADQTGD